jgi:23S rRNA (cytosine1962-C5)-methyltransferase
VTLSPRGASRIFSGHPWVYRSDVLAADNAAGGDTVRLRDSRGRFLGKAWFSANSQIAIRLLTREDVTIADEFLGARLEAAARYRERVVEDTAAYRLVYSESDGLPSIIVDRYGDYLVLQTLSQAAERHKASLVRLLAERFAPKGIVERNDPKVRLLEGLEQKVGVLSGECPPVVEVVEHGLTVGYDLLHGQKTGGFLDQRENRQAAARYVTGEVLDCFTYTGGFALAVARKAVQVEALDSSLAAVQAAGENVRRNNLTNLSCREANAFDVLKHYDDTGRRFDLVILDPPAFAKNKASLPAARRGYKEINLRAIKILRPGGILISCSCSHHIPEEMLLELIADAALEAHRAVTIVERRTQGRDHPIPLTMPESLYLKCFILSIE